MMPDAEMVMTWHLTLHLECDAASDVRLAQLRNACNTTGNVSANEADQANIGPPAFVKLQRLAVAAADVAFAADAWYTELLGVLQVVEA